MFGFLRRLFKPKAPKIKDYERVRRELVSEGWLQQIYNVEKNIAIYDITSLGYEYYFALCMTTGYDSLFNGPKLASTQSYAYINSKIDLVQEKLVVSS